MANAELDEETKLLLRALNISDNWRATVNPALVCPEGYDRLRGMDVLAVAYGLLVERIRGALAPWTWPPKEQVCDWCVRAAGDTDEAYRAATRYAYPEAIAEHANVCEHSPIAKLRRQLDETSAKLAALEARVDQGTWPGEVEANLKIAALEEKLVDLQAEMDELRG